MNDGREDVLQGIPFVVGKRPHCVWDVNLQAKNLEFVNGLAPEYFEHIVDNHIPLLEGDDKQLAATIIRSSYSHGIETLFALLGASLQAPDCVCGWLQKYKVKELRTIIKAISDGDEFYNIPKQKTISWDWLSQRIHQFELPDKDMDRIIKEGYSRIWQRFAKDFLDTKYYVEYNNIKHGLRMTPGGIRVAIRVETTPGVPASPTHSLGRSEFGSKIFIPERIGNKEEQSEVPHFRLRRTNLGWDPINLGMRLNLISFSLRNIITYIKTQNGLDASTAEFQWPKDLEYFDLPWKTAVPITSVDIDHVFTSADIRRVTKEEVFRRYNEIE